MSEGSPNDDGPGDVTVLLQEWSGGDPQAFDDLTRLLYAELHRLAQAFMRRERQDHTLQPTALLHEAFLRLLRQKRVTWQNREQFFAVAARLMRRILVDHARRAQADKRGGTKQTIAIDDAEVSTGEREVDLIALDEALKQLGELDSEQATIVELRYFAGLTIAETATVLDISPATVKRRWESARAWLYTKLEAS